jgi:hypothetical protein
VNRRLNEVEERWCGKEWKWKWKNIIGNIKKGKKIVMEGKNEVRIEEEKDKKRQK